MSIEEILSKAEQLPQQQQWALLEELYRRMEGRLLGGEDKGLAELRERIAANAGDGAPIDERTREIRELASKINWTQGDGLEYQMRIRSEWDDRPGWDR